MEQLAGVCVYGVYEEEEAVCSLLIFFHVPRVAVFYVEEMSSLPALFRMIARATPAGGNVKLERFELADGWEPVVDGRTIQVRLFFSSVCGLIGDGSVGRGSDVGDVGG